MLCVKIPLNFLNLLPPADQFLLFQILRDWLPVYPGAVRPLVGAILRKVQFVQLFQAAIYFPPHCLKTIPKLAALIVKGLGIIAILAG